MHRLGTLITLALAMMTQPGWPQKSRGAYVDTLRTCTTPGENSVGFPAHPVTEMPLHVTRVYVVSGGRFIEVRGCDSNRDFHFVRNIGDRDADLYTVPLLDPNHQDFLIRIGDTEGSGYFVHSAQEGYAEILSVEFWGDEKLEDSDGDGKFELMLQKIIKATCANGQMPSLVYDSEELQTIDVDTVCGQSGR